MKLLLDWYEMKHQDMTYLEHAILFLKEILRGFTSLNFKEFRILKKGFTINFNLKLKTKTPSN